VALSYRLELEGGLTAEVSSAPVWYLHGQQGLPPVLQRALEGHRQGDQVEVRLSPQEALGAYDVGLVARAPRIQFKDAEPLAISDRVTGHHQGLRLEGLVVALDDSTVTVDFNPFLAGSGFTAVLQVEAVADALPATTH
jgi:FKBP-type peptidyl-prolyl cis-trans isomerase SlyD